MWAWLRKLAKWPSKEDLGAARLLGPCWEMTTPLDQAAFVRALHALLPRGATLYLQGGNPGLEVARCLSGLATMTTFNVAWGTAAPEPLVWHVPATRAKLEALAALFVDHAPHEICDHFHVYHARRVLVQWYDALSTDPVLLSTDLPAAGIQALAERCSCTCRRATA